MSRSSPRRIGPAEETAQWDTTSPEIEKVIGMKLTLEHTLKVLNAYYPSLATPAEIIKEVNQ